MKCVGESEVGGGGGGGEGEDGARGLLANHMPDT